MSNIDSEDQKLWAKKWSKWRFFVIFGSFSRISRVNYFCTIRCQIVQLIFFLYTRKFFLYKKVWNFYIHFMILYQKCCFCAHKLYKKTVHLKSKVYTKFWDCTRYNEIVHKIPTSIYNHSTIQFKMNILEMFSLKHAYRKIYWWILNTFVFL